MRAFLSYLRNTSAAFRMLIVFTVILGVAYPLGVTAIAQIPGLRDNANGSLVTDNGKTVGSSQLGQSFTGPNGDPLVQYFQSRPSAAGGGYDPTASGASNLGPESIVDTLPDPAVPGDTGKQSLLTQVCARSAAIGTLEGVDGARPFCADGVGAVLAVFWSGPGYTGTLTRVVSVNQACPATPFLASYQGVAVECARVGDDVSHGQIVPIRGNAPANPVVPPDAVTASGSGLDPHISPQYAALQVARVAKARGVSADQVASLVSQYQDGRELGFMGEPTINVLLLNIALDKQFPYSRQ